MRPASLPTTVTRLQQAAQHAKIAVNPAGQRRRYREHGRCRVHPPLTCLTPNAHPHTVLQSAISFDHLNNLPW